MRCNAVSLLDAVLENGPIPPDTAHRADKKRYSELLSKHLAVEVGEGLRGVGFSGVRPLRGQTGEKGFQGGLGPKKVDVSHADEQHGLLLAISITSINFAPFGKNLKNRFGDLCTEAITLHMRFPYAVVCALFAFPSEANQDTTESRVIPTFERATELLSTISGRTQYTNAGERFENVTMMLYQPVTDGGPDAWVKLFDADTRQEISERDYFTRVREIYNARNPHAPIE